MKFEDDGMRSCWENQVKAEIFLISYLFISLGLFKRRHLVGDTVCFPQDWLSAVHRLTRFHCGKWWRTLINITACAGPRGGGGGEEKKRALFCFSKPPAILPCQCGWLIYHTSLRFCDIFAQNMSEMGGGGGDLLRETPGLAAIHNVHCVSRCSGGVERLVLHLFSCHRRRCWFDVKMSLDSNDIVNWTGITKQTIWIYLCFWIDYIQWHY